MLVGDIKAIDSTTVQITPTQNPANVWVAGTTSAIGDPWVASLQVWGAPYTGSPTSTSPMTGIISISNPNALSPILVTDLNPSTQYIFQLNTTDFDESSAFSPTAIISTSTAANDFSISANPSSLTVTQATSGTSAINTAVTSGSAQGVSLSISGVPSGASASFSPNPISSGGSSTLTINGGTAAPNTYTLTVTGTAASATHTTTVTLTVSVGTAALAVSPSQVTVAAGASQTFTASGGSGTGYTWDLATNNSGGAITAAGVYTAGATGGVTDVVRVTDSANHTATATVTVSVATAALAVSPSQVTVAAGASQTFTASGGSGTGYTWDLATNNSGGAVTAAGVYTAGATGGVTDVVRVTDSASHTATATVTVSPAGATLAVSPSQVMVAAGASQTFIASGGSGTGYSWDLATNNSGGAITAAGVYTAGATGGVTDVVRVTDSASHTATATVTVSMAGATLAVSPSQVTVAVGASQTFTASGGSGTGYTWDLATNSSGGAITAAGVYTAGATGGVTDMVRVTDSASHTATATVTVTARSVPSHGDSGCSATGARFPLLAFLVLLLLFSRRRRVTA